MQEELDFGASVWASPSDPTPPLTTLSTHPITPPFDDLGGFGETVEAAPTDEKEDDFGDFGEFGEAQEVDHSDFGDGVAFGEEQAPAPVEADWEPLRLHPMPSRSELHKRVNEILAPIWADDDISQVTTDEGIREVEGISRILVTPER
jgi:hypothetical protein